MRIPRIYCDTPLVENAELTLSEQATHHVRDVLRLKPGAELVLFNGEGDELVATLQSAKQPAMVRSARIQTPQVESPLSIRLVQGISRGERMDFTVQKAVELGVAEIIPVKTKRSVVRLDARRAERKHARWQKVAVAASEQSGRTRLPAIAAPHALHDCLSAPAPAGLRLLLDPAAERSLADLPAPDGSVTVLIGPEGGLNEQERAAAKAAGFMGVRLGPRILRTETAALVCLSLLQARFGDL